MNPTALLFAASPSSPEGGIPVGVIVVYVAIIAVMIAAQWAMFAKAGKPGWAAIIPIYNIIVMLEIIGKPIWWLFLLLIPCVGVIFAVLMVVELAKVFGKSGGFAVGLIFLPFIFYPILGFGSAVYQGPAKSSAY